MIRINTASFTPFYEQIKEQVKGQIGAGTLSPGDPLPSIRDLALSLLLNPNTVARAYRELELEGVIVTRQGKGSFVGEDSARKVRPERTDGVQRLLDQALELADRQGLTLEGVQALLEKRGRERLKAGQGRKRT